MATYDLLTEKSLLEEIANGNELAFRQVFETYKGRVFTFVVNYIHSEADAEEIVQDTFLTLWQNRVTLTNIEHPRNYIYTVVRNKTMNYLAKAARDVRMQKMILANMNITSNTTEESLNMRESQTLVKTALAELSEQKQRIFLMSREHGLSHEQIAGKTGLSRSRVKNIIVEVLKYIKVYLAEHALLISIVLLLSGR